MRAHQKSLFIMATFRASARQHTSSSFWTLKFHVKASWENAECACPCEHGHFTLVVCWSSRSVFDVPCFCIPFWRRRGLLKIVHARGAIPNEMGPTRCRAKEEEFIQNRTRARARFLTRWRKRRRRRRRRRSSESYTRAGAIPNEEEESNLINLKR
jgi:hypothetical protein